MTKQELEMCIDKYGRDIYSFCKYLTCNTQEADDLYQDTFLTATERMDRIEYDSEPKSYLLSVAVRLWKNKKRKFAWRKRIAEVQPIPQEQGGDIPQSPELSPEERVARQERDAAIRRAVSKLPEKLKITVLLFYMEELTTAQIAAALRIPPGTVLSRLHQARKILKRELEEVLNG